MPFNVVHFRCERSAVTQDFSWSSEAFFRYSLLVKMEPDLPRVWIHLCN